MMTNGQLVYMIERANDAQPFCACGRHTTPVWRDGAVWLECAWVTEPREGRLARIAVAVSAHTHTHERIVDVPAVASEPVLVGQPEGAPRRR